MIRVGMKRGNMVAVAVFTAFSAALMVVTIKRPEFVAPYARLLPRWAWRPLEVVSFLFLYGLTGLSIARRRRARRSGAWTAPPSTPFRR